MVFDSGNLEELLDQESDCVEWKESAIDSSVILHSVCALANDLAESGQEGFLLLGVNKNGDVVGTDVSDDAQQRVSNWFRSTKIWPHPSCTVQTAKHADRDLLIVRVEPYLVPPVVTVNGVSWVRVGSTTRRATESDLTRLQERRPDQRQPFDLRPWRNATLSDLDEAHLREVYRVEHDSDHDSDTFPSFEVWLGQKDLARRTTSGWVPTATGLLVFGVDPQSSFPGALAEFARYAGTEFDSQVVTRRTATGRVTDQLDAVWSQLQANIADMPAGDAGIKTQYASEYPLEALKELARNLVQHRLYEGTNAPGRISWLEDRIVFNNPGNPFGQASQGSFGEHADYRNPTLTRHLMELGYVERLGRGIRRVKALLEKNGNPPLEVETDNYTTVTVRRR